MRAAYIRNDRKLKNSSINISSSFYKKYCKGYLMIHISAICMPLKYKTSIKNKIYSRQSHSKRDILKHLHKIIQLTERCNNHTSVLFKY